jgi:hypothetical protein
MLTIRLAFAGGAEFPTGYSQPVMERGEVLEDELHSPRRYIQTGGAENLGDMTDRRTARRYDLSLPVLIKLPIEQDARNGKTRDISTRGVYFHIGNHLAAGSELDLTMTLPAEVTGGTEVFIRAIGKVVRVEKISDEDDSQVGVAALIQRYEIVRNESLKS